MKYLLGVTFACLILIGINLFLSYRDNPYLFRDLLYDESLSPLYGFSMSQYGFSMGDSVVVHEGPCQVGDICAFTCNSDRCTNPQHPEGQGRMKILKSVENGCYFFQGNDDISTSWDSRSYGCLTEDEFEMIGYTYPESR